MHTLKDLKLYTEDNQYYLDAIIEEENKGGVYQVHIPKIKLPVNLHPNLCQTCEYYYRPYYSTTIDFGFGELLIEPFRDDELFTIKCIEREMTLAEIEKELGYKIELKKEN